MPGQNKLKININLIKILKKQLKTNIWKQEEKIKLDTNSKNAETKNSNLQQIKNSNPANQELPNQTQQPKNSNPNH